MKNKKIDNQVIYLNAGGVLKYNHFTDTLIIIDGGILESNLLTNCIIFIKKGTFKNNHLHFCGTTEEMADRTIDKIKKNELSIKDAMKKICVQWVIDEETK